MRLHKNPGGYSGKRNLRNTVEGLFRFMVEFMVGSLVREYLGRKCEISECGLKSLSIFGGQIITQKSISHSFPDNDKIGVFVVYLGGYKGLGGKIRGYWGTLGGLSSRFSSSSSPPLLRTQFQSQSNISSSPPLLRTQFQSQSNISSSPHLILSSEPSPILICRVSIKKIEQLFIRMNPTTNSNYQLLLEPIL